jgi:uncharacterized repeat protein (TIGR01451 family)
VRISAVIRGVLVACVMSAIVFPGAASADRAYTKVFTDNVQGDITGTGNTLMSCFSVDPRCAAARNGTASGTDLNNNGLSMDWVDVDNDSSTFNSSTARLTLPAGARVLFARLYYTGRLQQGADANCPQRPPPAAPCLRGRPAPDTGARNRVKFKTPGLNDYVTLTAGRVEDALDTTNGVAREYQGIVDVTSLVATGGAGVYGVANVQLGTGLDADQAGGWALAVAYEDSSKPTRNLTIFDGFRFVLANGAPVDIPLSGFVTPKSGPVTTNIGLVAIEGDLGTTGDSATINADASGSAASGSCPPILPGRPCRLTNPANPANNFFNASIADRNGVTFTQRDPAFPNQMGFDADIVGATRNLANDQTSTTLRLATDGDGFAPNAVSFATDLFAPSLLVNKAVSPTGAVDLGAPLTYTVDVTNTGLDAARQTVLTDAIPDGTTYVPGSLRVLVGANTGTKSDAAGDDQAEFDPAADAVVFRLGLGAGATAGGRLGIGDTTRISFQVKVDATGLPSNFKVVNDAGVGYVADTLNTPGHVTSPDVITPVRIPDVTIDKSHDGAFESGRAAVPFTLVVRNIGDAPTSGPVRVTDPLPDPLTFVARPSGDGWDCGATTARAVDCTSSDPLAPEDAYPKITFSARVRAGTPDQELENVATVNADPDGDPSNNTDVNTGAVHRPVIDLAIAKTAATPVVFAGGEVHFTLQISNNGPDTATRVRVRDVLPPGLTPIRLTPSRGICSGTTCRLGDMSPGATATIDVRAVAGDDTGGRRLRDVAAVRGREHEAVRRNNIDSAVVRVLPLVDLAVTKTTATPTVTAGDRVSWDVVVTNDGPSTATQVTMTDTLPAPLTLISAVPTQGTCTGLTCNLGTLARGASAQIVVTAASDPSVAGSTLTNVAVVESPEPELELANNRATSDVTFTAAPIPPADVVVTKAADTTTVSVGGSVTYTITATNQGAGPAQSAIVTDTPDPSLQVISVTPSQGTCAPGVPIVCDVGPLAPGASATVVVVATATAAGTLANAVTVLPTTGGGATGPPATAVAGVTAQPAPAIAVAGITAQSAPAVTLRKRANRNVVRPGGRVLFTMTATARGSGIARNVRVCDRLPAGMTVIRAGRARKSGPLWCWTIAALPAGQSRNMRLLVAVSASVAGRRMTNRAVLSFAAQPPRTARARIRVLAGAPSFTG